MPAYHPFPDSELFYTRGILLDLFNCSINFSVTENCVLCYNIFSLSDACDPSWRLSRDGLIVAGFVVSILVFILAIILLIIAFCLHKKKVRNCSFVLDKYPTYMRAFCGYSHFFQNT